MQNTYRNKKQSTKNILLKRHTREIVNFLIQTSIVISIILSTYVIYQKRQVISDLMESISAVIRQSMQIPDNINTMFNSNIKTINISGNSIVSNNDILSLIECKDKRNNSIICDDLSRIYQKLSTIPFIKSIIIKRDIMRELTIKIEEKNIIGSIEYMKKQYLLDEDGLLIDYEGLNTEKFHFPKILKYSVINIENLKNIYSLLLNNMPELLPHIVEMDNISDRRWDLILHNGIKIILPATVDLYVIDLILYFDKTITKITADNANIEYVDLRVKNRIYYNPKK